jgi:hypothetical protein
VQRTLRWALTGATVGAMLLAGSAVAAHARGSGDQRSATSVARSTDARQSSEVRQEPAAASWEHRDDHGRDDSATRNDSGDHGKGSGVGRDDSRDDSHANGDGKEHHGDYSNDDHGDDD